jgi:hypothetical protein
MKYKTKLRTLIGALMIFSMTMSQVHAVPDEFQLPSASWTPEHPLYGLERFLEERIEVPLSRIRGGKEGEAEKRLQLAEERLAEMEQVANGTRVEALEDLRQGYMRQMNRSRQLVNGSEELDQWLLNRTMTHAQVLTRVRARVPVQARQGIDRAFNASTQNIGLQIRDMNRNRVNASNLNETSLRLRERIREYQRIRENAPSDGPPINIGMPSWLQERGKGAQSGPP